MRLGILGTGMIVKDLLTTIHKFDLKKRAILGTPNKKEVTKKLAEKYRIDHCCDDYDEFLEYDIDTVYVALPNSLHHSYAKKALLKGKHVIIEKPITANSKELRELMGIAKAGKLMIFEAMNLHYMPAFHELKKDVKKLGKIRMVSFNFSQYSSRYDSFKQGNILPVFDYHKAGGALMDINSYNIHTIIGLFGIPEKAVYHANIVRGIDTSGVMLLDYEDFKAVSIGAKDCRSPNISTIQGEQGMILIEKATNQLTKYRIFDDNGKQEEKSYEDGEHRLAHEFREFIRIVDEKDYKKQEELLQISYEIAQIMEKARKAEGIIFDSD